MQKLEGWFKEGQVIQDGEGKFEIEGGKTVSDKEAFKYHDILVKVRADRRYIDGIEYGRPRPGHAEGTVREHIKQLEENLEIIRNLVRADEYWKLKVLIHVHDTFKGMAVPNSPITDPKSHASLAKAYLAEFTTDEDMLNMVQFHDENLALYIQFEDKGKYSPKRMDRFLSSIKSMDLMLIFTLIDGYTPSKDHGRIRWFVDEVNRYVQTPRVYDALEIFGITEDVKPGPTIERQSRRNDATGSK